MENEKLIQWCRDNLHSSIFKGIDRIDEDERIIYVNIENDGEYGPHTHEFFCLGMKDLLDAFPEYAAVCIGDDEGLYRINGTLSFQRCFITRQMTEQQVIDVCETNQSLCFESNREINHRKTSIEQSPEYLEIRKKYSEVNSELNAESEKIKELEEELSELRFEVFINELYYHLRKMEQDEYHVIAKKIDDERTGDTLSAQLRNKLAEAQELVKVYEAEHGEGKVEDYSKSFVKKAFSGLINSKNIVVNEEEKIVKIGVLAGKSYRSIVEKTIIFFIENPHIAAVSFTLNDIPYILTRQMTSDEMRDLFDKGLRYYKELMEEAKQQELTVVHTPEYLKLKSKIDTFEKEEAKLENELNKHKKELELARKREESTFALFRPFYPKIYEEKLRKSLQLYEEMSTDFRVEQLKLLQEAQAMVKGAQPGSEN